MAAINGRGLSLQEKKRMIQLNFEILRKDLAKKRISVPNYHARFRVLSSLRRSLMAQIQQDNEQLVNWAQDGF